MNEDDSDNRYVEDEVDTRWLSPDRHGNSSELSEMKQ